MVRVLRAWRHTVSVLVVGAWLLGGSLPYAQTAEEDEDDRVPPPVLESFPYEASAQVALDDRPSLRVRDRRLRLRASVRGFAQVGPVRFAASDSFRAITGSSSGLLVGGGLQLATASGLFVQGSFERFSATGSRVFVFDGETFDVGVENTVTVTPILLTVGYRQVLQHRYVGYVGGGPGWLRFQETSPFSEPNDQVTETASGFHVLGGLEVPVGRWLWVGGEAQWVRATGVLGESGVSSGFDEDDLGGFTVRFKVSIGR